MLKLKHERCLTNGVEPWCYFHWNLGHLSTSRRLIKLLHPYDCQQLIIPELIQYYIFIHPLNPLKTNINPNNIKNSVHTSWETKCISITATAT